MEKCFNPKTAAKTLTQDNASSLASRVKKTDAREIESYYQQYYEHYVRALDKGEQADRYLQIAHV